MYNIQYMPHNLFTQTKIIEFLVNAITQLTQTESVIRNQSKKITHIQTTNICPSKSRTVKIQSQYRQASATNKIPRHFFVVDRKRRVQ